MKAIDDLCSNAQLCCHHNIDEKRGRRDGIDFEKISV